MKLLSTLFIWIVGFGLFTFSLALTTTQTKIVKHTDSVDPEKDGFWSRHVSWKSRWVKYWRPKAIYVPVWKKVWSPVISNEWVPLPNAPTGWTKSSKGHKITEVE